ncbi:hypothetical protein [Chromobacterium phragmitis]|uniref:hypothetical protein n=1 Tax=Chromobacterium phragmitis TaxID=2202141 RepID=UPI003877D764
MTEAEEIAADLREEGQDVKIERRIAGGYDPEQGGEVETVETDTVPGAELEFDLQSSGQLFAAGLVKAGDKRVLLSVPKFPPEPGQFITLARGRRYRIEGVKEVGPSGAPILYDLHVRR